MRRAKLRIEEGFVVKLDPIPDVADKRSCYALSVHRPADGMSRLATQLYHDPRTAVVWLASDGRWRAGLYTNEQTRTLFTRHRRTLPRVWEWEATRFDTRAKAVRAIVRRTMSP